MGASILEDALARLEHEKAEMNAQYDAQIRGIRQLIEKTSGKKLADEIKSVIEKARAMPVVHPNGIPRTNIAYAEEAIRAAGKPVHISTILEHIKNQKGKAPKRRVLATSLRVHERRSDRRVCRI